MRIRKNRDLSPNAMHSGTETEDGDVVLFTVEDSSHSLHGVKAG